MTVQLPKQDGATVKVTFQCGISVRLILDYYSDTNQYDLRIAYDPDDEKTGYRTQRLHDVYKDRRTWNVFRDECYYTDTHEHWYDVYAYVAENDDSYDIRIRLYETRAYEE
jgi:hypothetical protein